MQFLTPKFALKQRKQHCGVLEQMTVLSYSPEIAVGRTHANWASVSWQESRQDQSFQQGQTPEECPQERLADRAAMDRDRWTARCHNHMLMVAHNEGGCTNLLDKLLSEQ